MKDINFETFLSAYKKATKSEWKEFKSELCLPHRFGSKSNRLCFSITYGFLDKLRKELKCTLPEVGAGRLGPHEGISWASNQFHTFKKQLKVYLKANR